MASGHPAKAASGPRDYDPEINDMASYIHNYNIDSELAYDTARFVFLDTLGCGLEALRYPVCTKLLGPTVEGLWFRMVPKSLVHHTS